MRRWLPLLVLLLLPVRLLACINDRDTDALVEEARDLPDIGYILTGRFQRNPPRYYEVRIRNTASRIADKETPDMERLYLFDDVAAACDRSGKSAEAIQWMEKKRGLLVTLEARQGKDDPEIQDNRYRYHANIGTFLAHDWLHSGAKPETFAQMKSARDHIVKALKINPDAHFGRERFQLKAMEWIIDLYQRNASARQGAKFAPTKGSSLTLGEYILKTENPEAAVTGLAGLVALGNAWESVDVFDAVAQCLYRLKKARVGHLASLRVKELLTNGKKSFVASGYFTAERMETIIRGESRNRVTHYETTEKKYEELRAGAEKWHTHRIAFMERRLQAGKHPDTDKDFWNGYTEVPQVSLDIPWYEEAGTNFAEFLRRNVWIVNMVFLGIIGGVLYAGVWSIKKLIAFVRHRISPM